MQIDCFKINVDCQENNSLDVKYGAPWCLGYSFFVQQTDVDKMINFITETCYQLQVPVIQIYYNKNEVYNIDQSQVDTKDSMFNKIKNNDAHIDLTRDNLTY